MMTGLGLPFRIPEAGFLRRQKLISLNRFFQPRKGGILAWDFLSLDFFWRPGGAPLKFVPMEQNRFLRFSCLHLQPGETERSESPTDFASPGSRFSLSISSLLNT